MRQAKSRHIGFELALAMLVVVTAFNSSALSSPNPSQDEQRHALFLDRVSQMLWTCERDALATLRAGVDFDTLHIEGRDWPFSTPPLDVTARRHDSLITELIADGVEPGLQFHIESSYCSTDSAGIPVERTVRRPRHFYRYTTHRRIPDDNQSDSDWISRLSVSFRLYDQAAGQCQISFRAESRTPDCAVRPCEGYHIFAQIPIDYEDALSSSSVFNDRSRIRGHVQETTMFDSAGSMRQRRWEFTIEITTDRTAIIETTFDITETTADRTMVIKSTVDSPMTVDTIPIAPRFQ